MNVIVYLLLSVVVVVIIGLIFTQISNGPNFEDNIGFEVVEEFTDKFDGPHLFLKVNTEKIYPCSNYKFSHSVNTKGEVKEIILSDVKRQDFCLTALGPAKFAEDLHIKEGIYKLELKSKNSTDVYILKVSDRNVSIDTIQSHFSKLKNSKIIRLPKNLMWAQCFYNDDWESNPLDDFCDKFFKELNSIATIYLKGNENAPKIPENQFYLYDGSDQPLVNIIQKYQRDQFYVRISRWSGKDFICPVNCNRPSVAYVPEIKIEYAEGRVTSLSECDDSSAISFCIIKVAMNTKNETICETEIARLGSNQWQCFMQLGILKSDDSLCEKSNSPNCFESVAIQTNNPNICEKLNGINKDDCYLAYAQSKNDQSYCDKIKYNGPLQKCRDHFS